MTELNWKQGEGKVRTGKEGKEGKDVADVAKICLLNHLILWWSETSTCMQRGGRKFIVRSLVAALAMNWTGIPLYGRFIFV